LYVFDSIMFVGVYLVFPQGATVFSTVNNSDS